jgi:hypothetical protein
MESRAAEEHAEKANLTLQEQDPGVATLQEFRLGLYDE